MWISEYWYEKLPTIYAIGGLLVLAMFGPQGPAVISALLLFAAAALTWAWRRHHRGAPTPKTVRRPSFRASRI